MLGVTMEGELYVFRRPEGWVDFLNALNLGEIEALIRRGLKLDARLQHFEQRNGLEHRFGNYDPKLLTVTIDYRQNRIPEGTAEDYCPNPFSTPQFVSITACGNPQLVARCWNEFFPAKLAQGYCLQGPECGVTIGTAPNIQFGTRFIQIGAELIRVLPEFDSSAGKVGSMDNLHISLTQAIEAIRANYPVLKEPLREEAAVPR